MNRYLVSPEAQIVDSDIVSLEEEYSISFPPSYRDFLKKHNGGHPETENDLMALGVFYAIADVPTSLSSAIYERELDHLIPFAESGNEDQISFDFKDGTIWHLGKKIALSFDEFVSSYLSPIQD